MIVRPTSEVTVRSPVVFRVAVEIVPPPLIVIEPGASEEAATSFNVSIETGPLKFVVSLFSIVTVFALRVLAAVKTTWSVAAAVF